MNKYKANYSIKSSKVKSRGEIESHVAAFLAGGGEIDVSDDSNDLMHSRQPARCASPSMV